MVVAKKMSKISNSTPLPRSTGSTKLKQPKESTILKTKLLEIPKPEDRNSSIDLNASSKLKYERVELLSMLLASLIALAGIALGILVTFISLENADEVAFLNLQTYSDARTKSLEDAVQKYIVAAALSHYSSTSDRALMSRSSFKTLHETVIKNGLKYQSIELIPRISAEERHKIEKQILNEQFSESSNPFKGFVGFKEIGYDSTNMVLKNRSLQPFYFPVLYVEPLEGNEEAVGYDLYSNSDMKTSIDEALSLKKPIVSPKLTTVHAMNLHTTRVVLFHPGTSVSSGAADQSSELDQILVAFVISIPDLLLEVFEGLSETVTIFLFDLSNLSDDKYPSFLGNYGANLKIESYTELLDYRENNECRYIEKVMKFAQNDWKIVVLQRKEVPEGSQVFLGAIFLMMCSLLTSVWILYRVKSNHEISEFRNNVRRTEAKMKIENEKEKIKAERDLNEFIAHEVRNPLSAAMNATSFVKETIDEGIGRCCTDNDIVEQIKTVKEDLSIIDVSLKFVNDLLRSTLDLHNSEKGILQLNFGRVHLLKEVLDPVKAMVCQKSCSQSHIPEEVVVEVNCPSNLIINTDRIRLEQIIINLVSNSVKFVKKGFIRLNVIVADKNVVEVIVEDSGPGIPLKSRSNLFSKYEDNLQKSSQGTGIGLCLCKSLVQLMNGSIRLDENFDSEIPGQPGARFVISLPTYFYDPVAETEKNRNNKTLEQNSKRSNIQCHEHAKLPEKLRVLIVDDDPILRSLFRRAVLRVCPLWEVKQAKSGEEALEVTKHHEFDLIFVDQYMTSIEKSLLGTETVEALRNAGVKSVVIGLSANDIQDAFQVAGANFFTQKPFPSEKETCAKYLSTFFQPGNTDFRVHRPITSESEICN